MKLVDNTFRVSKGHVFENNFKLANSFRRINPGNVTAFLIPTRFNTSYNCPTEAAFH